MTYSIIIENADQTKTIKHHISLDEATDLHRKAIEAKANGIWIGDIWDADHPREIVNYRR